MANISWADEKVLAQLLKMGGGYVLDFSDATFSRFFADLHIDIDKERYSKTGGSKGRRMRAFLGPDHNYTVARVIKPM